MHAFRAAIEAKDLDAAVATFAPDIVLNSPVAFKPFVGKESAAGVIAAIFTVLEDFSYTDELDNGDTTALLFSATVGGKQLQGLDYVHHNADGLIDEFTVMMRPLSAIMAVGDAMRPKVEGLAKA